MDDEITGNRTETELPDEALTTRVRRHYSALTKLEQRLADVILDCPGDVASYTATELAGLAGVSKMTVSRLVRRLGYASFEEARLASRGAAEQGSPLYLLRKSDDDAPQPALDAHFANSIDAIVATAGLCGAARIGDAAQALYRARRVFVCGQRNSAHLAGYARWQFIQFRDDVHGMNGPGETWGETLAGMGPDDALFLVAIRRRSPAVRKLLETVTARNIPFVLLIDNHTPLEIPEPPLTLRCQTRSLVALDNHVAAVAVIHALTAELIRLAGAAGRERIGRIEAFHDDLGEI